MRGEALTHIGGADNPTFTEPVVCTYDQRTQPKRGIDWGEPTPESEAFWAAVKKGRVPEAEAGDQLRAARGRTPDTSEQRHGKLSPHVAEIVQRYNAGESSTDLARTFGATGATVLALLRREGVTIRARGQRWSPDVIADPEPAKRRSRRPTPRPRQLPSRRSHVDTAEILRRYTAGQTIAEVADGLGYNKMTVRRHLLDAGVQLRDDRARNGGQNRIDAYPAELVDGVRDLYANGFTQHEVADRLGTTPKVVQTVMRKHGITPRPAAPRPGRSALVNNTKRSRDRLAAFGVTSREIKQWALEHGHIPAIVRGCVPAAVVDLYEAAHPARSTP